MASAASEAAVNSLRGNAREMTRGSQDAAVAAWLCAIPCATIATLAILILGPPLGELLQPAHSPYTFLSGSGPLHPEPTEHARYLIAICAPLLGMLAMAAAPRWFSRVPAGAVGPLLIATQLALAALIVASIVAQYHLRYGVAYTNGREPALKVQYFKWATLGIAALLAVTTAAALRSERVRARAAATISLDSRRLRIVVGGLALAVTAIWMLHAIHSDAEIGNAAEDLRYHLGFTLDETFAVLNGRTPLVDFTAQYASLWPFVIALPMLGVREDAARRSRSSSAPSPTLALLAIYGVMRRVTAQLARRAAAVPAIPRDEPVSIVGTLAEQLDRWQLLRQLPTALRGAVLARMAHRATHRGRRWADLRPVAAVHRRRACADQQRRLRDRQRSAPHSPRCSGAAVAPSRRKLLRLVGTGAGGLATAFALVSLVTLVRAGHCRSRHGSSTTRAPTASAASR